MDDATPTFSSSVNSRSRMGGTVSTLGESQGNASQSRARCKASTTCKRSGIKWQALHLAMAERAEISAKLRPCYTSRFPMSAKYGKP
jgi:hypothetical protein